MGNGYCPTLKCLVKPVPSRGYLGQSNKLNYYCRLGTGWQQQGRGEVVNEGGGEEGRREGGGEEGGGVKGPGGGGGE